MASVEIVTVSEKGQIVLPKKTREKLMVSKGTRLLLVENKGTIVLSKAEKIIKEKKSTKGISTYIASEKVLKKDWDFKGDDVWNGL